MTLLQISNLCVKNENVQILKDLNLIIKKNETHVIMGPNGSGKSTLAKVLAGDPNYKITSGTISFMRKNLELLSPQKRARAGIFLAFQSPVEINSLNSFDFFYLLYNEGQLYKKKNTLSPLEFLPLIQTLFKEVGLKEELLNRNFNEGFSGGEKKKIEILQMLLLKPKLIILDEIDSGLDIDALKQICEILKQTNSALLVITHYPKIVNLLKPDFIHVFSKGKIQKTGTTNLIQEIEKKGYDFFNTKTIS